MKRFASHFLLFREKDLAEEIVTIIRRDEISLTPVPSSVLMAYPEGTEGFSFCCIELTIENKLVRIFPFTGEIESTFWIPGILTLPVLLEMGEKSVFSGTNGG